VLPPQSTFQQKVYIFIIKIGISEQDGNVRRA